MAILLSLPEEIPKYAPYTHTMEEMGKKMRKWSEEHEEEDNGMKKKVLGSLERIRREI